MEVLLAKEMGFCFGVKRALALVEAAAAKGGGLHTLGAVVHNRQVVAHLESLGVACARSLEEVGQTLAVPSHGASPQIFAEAEARGLQVVDATCPMVRTAQKKAESLARDGFQVIIFGDPGHAEVRGMAAWAEPKAVVVTTEDDLAGLPSARKLAVLSQTTQSLAAFRRLVGTLIEQRLGEASQVVVHNTICNATLQRQQAALELAQEVEVMVVVGGHDSANTRRLMELCGRAGVPTYQVESADEVQPAWFAGFCRAGVTAGASTPDWIIEPVVERIRAFGD